MASFQQLDAAMDEASEVRSAPREVARPFTSALAAVLSPEEQALLLGIPLPQPPADRQRHQRHQQHFDAHPLYDPNTLDLLVQLLGPLDWLHIAGVCPAWRDAYWSQFESKRTSYNRAAESISRLALSWPPPEVSKWGYVLWPAIGEEGRVPVVEWAIQTYCPNGVAPSHVLDNITEGAARGRRLPLLQWAFDRGALSQYHMTNMMLAHATSVRGLPVFLWAWEHEFCDRETRVLACLAQAAAHKGCVGILEHMHARLGRYEFRRKLCCPGHWLHVAAVEGSQLQVLQWLEAYNALPPRDARPRIAACEEAALAADNPDVIAWLREAGFGWGSKVCTRAAERGHLNVLKWLRDARCPAWESAGQELCVAATYGTVEVLEWLRAAGKGTWDNAGVEELIRGSSGRPLLGVRGYGTHSIRMQRRTPMPQVTQWLRSQLMPPPPPLPLAESEDGSAESESGAESVGAGAEESEESEAKFAESDDETAAALVDAPALGDREEAAASASTNGAPVWSLAMFAIANDMVHPHPT
eukprot:TRINITY_DN1743_c0_g2_i1.p1 TRINITY_DN1743_c0_g2~~TRINITY_DN1743_c0_g2_i1.p1  ORF type:complete len:528 (-),score=72.77 TRINITY_DN1743_c0_g2_i1:228-1811(-)